jgi:hypothetical protein
MDICPRCKHRVVPGRLFCVECGKLVDPAGLRSTSQGLLGPIGVLHSTSPEIEEFWATGDETVFDRRT